MTADLIYKGRTVFRIRSKAKRSITCEVRRRLDEHLHLLSSNKLAQRKWRVARGDQRPISLRKLVQRAQQYRHAVCVCVCVYAGSSVSRAANWRRASFSIPPYIFHLRDRPFVPPARQLRRVLCRVTVAQPTGPRGFVSPAASRNSTTRTSIQDPDLAAFHGPLFVRLAFQKRIVNARRTP